MDKTNNNTGKSYLGEMLWQLTHQAETTEGKELLRGGLNLRDPMETGSKETLPMVNSWTKKHLAQTNLKEFEEKNE